MKYCINCGTELLDEAVICPKCGCFSGDKRGINSSLSVKTGNNRTLSTVAKIFMIIGVVLRGLWLVTLAWSIPMTVTYFQKTNNGEKVSTGFKVCVLIFVNMVAGILMLCDSDS